MASGISPQQKVPSMTRRQISRVDAAIGRQAISMLVRWCPVGQQWEEDTEDPFPCSGCNPTHLLRRRRMLVCSVCKMAFFTKKGFEDHECFDRY